MALCGVQRNAPATPRPSHTTTPGGPHDRIPPARSDAHDPCPAESRPAPRVLVVARLHLRLPAPGAGPQRVRRLSRHAHGPAADRWWSNHPRRSLHGDPGSRVHRDVHQACAPVTVESETNPHKSNLRKRSLALQLSCRALLYPDHSARNEYRAHRPDQRLSELLAQCGDHLARRRNHDL